MIENLVILIPFTAESIKVSRGGPVVEQLDILMRTFQRSSLEIVKSIIPVLTKVKPDDDEFDFDMFQSEMLEIMHNDMSNYLNTLQTQLPDSTKQSSVSQQDIDLFSLKSNHNQIEPHKIPILKEYCERKLFFEGFVDQMVICDPLDRCGNPEKYPAMVHHKVLRVD